MAGDHKCPVCQATFTRPQHVARHMRSPPPSAGGFHPDALLPPRRSWHFDCFRTDCPPFYVSQTPVIDLTNASTVEISLLEGDKPPTTTAPTRRKGLVSSTRATTSKQACDQCVIATLPCDGANPCSKCIQRKSPCTYVKFQRQTAPSGPGHKNSLSVDSSTSIANLAGAVPRPDELFLGPPPMTVPSMSSTGELLYPAQFAFNAPPGAPAWDSDSLNSPALSFSGTDSGGDSSSSDPSHYHNADMMRAAGLVFTSYPPGAGGIGLPYNSVQQEQQAAGPNDAWQFPSDFRMPMRKMDEGFAQYLPSGTSTQMGGSSTVLNPNNLGFNNGNSVGNGGLYSLQTRRGSIDGFSDTSGVSAPNSAASSSVHLPLDFGSTDLSQGTQQIQPLSSLYQFDENQQPPPSREGRVASSFGLMSIADGDQPFIGNFNSNNNNNNMPVDGTAPFFSQHAMKLPPQDSTPRPLRNDENRMASPRDRESDMRELREFWKQYLRTPLTGPSLGQTPKAELLNSQFGSFGDSSRPTPKRGLSRVASLPSVRTPPDEKSSVLPSRVSNPHSQSHAQLPAIPGNDDLRSYEEAVLARKPLNLTFVPRKGRHSISSSASPQLAPDTHQQMFPPGQTVDHRMFVAPGPLAGLASTDGGNSSDDNPVSNDGNPQRPSFKRLASQTLESGTQKRTLFRWGESEDAIDDTDSDADMPSEMGSPPHHYNGSNSDVRTNSMSPSSYHRGMQFAHAGAIGAKGGSDILLDRFRRQSAPTTIRPNIVGMDLSNGNAMDSSPSPVPYSASPLQVSHSQANVGVSHHAPQPRLPGVNGNSLVQT